jgi:hypothetical protein
MAAIEKLCHGHPYRVALFKMGIPKRRQLPAMFVASSTDVSSQWQPYLQPLETLRLVTVTEVGADDVTIGNVVRGSSRRTSKDGNSEKAATACDVCREQHRCLFSMAAIPSISRSG